ncbi:Permuted papain-like amidase enzyme, YaeF/YiiX, C92 family [Lutibacter oricola]|uniref:Permuted papain-like amidase enzyme, YaeF/YiiX, C92 family n=1 Tax=Lutibacter oricola TaxID=762486 RepID=A0A1H2RJ87_9FLAO|nr:YiiX/YebB-like N1pC/P60 family cysteine hydrolase [Lutibacter oricola]SDW18709.1 Permuted papain-like amidase enzyme, YaeF/YiiX, C92 family [Lutibacter oricola]
MSRVLMVLLFILLVNSTFGQPNEKMLDEISITYKNYSNLIENHYNYQVELINEIDYFNKIEHKNYVLKGLDLKQINSKFSKIINLLQQSITFNNKKNSSQKKNGPNKLSLNEKIMLDLIFIHLRIKAFETYTLQQKMFKKNIKIANLLNEENRIYNRKKNSFKNISKIIISNKYRKSIIKNWLFVSSYDSIILNNKINNYLFKKITSTKYFQEYLKTSEHIKISKKRYTYLIKQKRAFNTKRGFTNFINSLVFGCSKIIGNTAGIIATRKGKLLNKKQFSNAIKTKSKPLDVFLEKTPFRLTDKFIPGYWGHAAIYIGNENQLKELGVWENPLVKKYHQTIKNGACIIEALRSDVALHEFKKFTNIDDFAHLRLKNKIPLAKKREMLIRAFAQIGKKYDFRFDIESSKKIVCTELHYMIFDEVKFNTTKNFGRYTLSADKIAEQALKNKPFKLINLYINGVEVTPNKRQTIYKRLLK